MPTSPFPSSTDPYRPPYLYLSSSFENIPLAYQVSGSYLLGECLLSLSMVFPLLCTHLSLHSSRESCLCVPPRIGACRGQGLTMCLGEHFSPMYNLTIKEKKCLCLCLMCLTTQVAWLGDTCTPWKVPSQGVPFLRIFFQNPLRFRNIKPKKKSIITIQKFFLT